MYKNIFSAIQPTGQLTIGHYLGVLKLWKELQNNNNCFYCIANLHSLTIPNKNNLIYSNCLDLLSLFLATGIDPLKCIIFLQSDIVEHIQLYWILSCYSYIGELNRMTQFKDKSKNHNNNLSLFSYPLLMAADILLYNINNVCIGFDQIQHIELVRKISKRFNKIYKKKIFVIPKYILNIRYSKIMSLINVNKKMSKSDLNKNNIIFLLDTPDLIKYKINNSKTDSDNPSRIKFDVINKPGISNLLNILSGIKNISINELENKFINFSYSSFKEIVSYELSKFVSKLQKKYLFYRNNEIYLKKILYKGKKKAKKIAKNKITKLFNLLNLI